MTTSTSKLEAQRAYYDEYWRTHQQRLNAHEVLRLGEIFMAMGSILPDFAQGQELKVCDLGCGRGWLSNELSRFGPVTAVDLSPTAVEAARARWPQPSFVSADILSWRPSETFDVVVSSEVLEHVPDHRQFAETVRHLLRKGGYLVLTTPNGRVKSAWDAGDMGQQFMENWITPSQLRALFAGVGGHIYSHENFLLDFSYVGLHRFTSAQKLLKLIRAAGLLRSYDFVRKSLGLGLYQIIVAKFAPAP